MFGISKNNMFSNNWVDLKKFKTLRLKLFSAVHFFIHFLYSFQYEVSGTKRIEFAQVKNSF